MHSICVNVLHFNSDASKLHSTLASIQQQGYEMLKVNVLSNSELVDVAGSWNVAVAHSIDDIPHKLYDLIDTTEADLYILAQSGDRFFEQAFHSASSIFSKFSEIEWITGIETVQSAGGYNVIQGNTSVRRWNSRLFRNNMYQTNARYIPSAGTVWRKTLWNKVKHKVNFVSGSFAHNDLWDAFLKISPPYACDVYFSAKAYECGNYNVPTMVESILSEKRWFNQVFEFLYLNNVPYLRAYYRYANRFVQVIRFDHKAQSYFLSDY